MALSLTFDVALPNGQSTRHPDANQFIDELRERLHQAIEVYEKTPLGNDDWIFVPTATCEHLSLANFSAQKVEIDPEARKALNFIETGKSMVIVPICTTVSLL